MLVYDNHKAGRAQRRLPVSETTAKVIIAQQQRVRARFPGTPVGELKLLPTDRRNPRGRTAITAFSFAFAHRIWVSRMPVAAHQRRDRVRQTACLPLRLPAHLRYLYCLRPYEGRGFSGVTRRCLTNIRYLLWHVSYVLSRDRVGWPAIPGGAGGVSP